MYNYHYNHTLFNEEQHDLKENYENRIAQLKLKRKLQIVIIRTVII